MFQERLNPELAAVEAALASLVPKASGVDRDRLMFLAGQAAARPRRGAWLWPCATAASLLLAAALGITIVVHGGPRTLERIVYVPVQPQAASEWSATVAFDRSPEPMRADYLRLRRTVLDRGVEAISESPAAAPRDGRPSPKTGNRQLLEQLLHG
jgi:hypothetical protein